MYEKSVSLNSESITLYCNKVGFMWILKGKVSMQGKVKTFNKQKGYGFIRCELEEDIFFHYSSLIMDGFKTIDVGADVEFELEETSKGKRATNIKVVTK